MEQLPPFAALRRLADPDEMPFEGEENCRNPLFSTHWAGKSDILHLNAEPSTQYDLRLCPFYNGRVACCSASFEAEQEEAFRRWVEHFRRKMSHLHDFQLEMEGLKVSETYLRVDYAEKALFNKAFSTFNEALETAGTCFDTLLEYMAGALCFACDPRWKRKVLTNDAGTAVVAVRVSESSNEDLWVSCSEFAAAADELMARVGEASLAKAIISPIEDLSPFVSRIGVAEYMAAKALAPMRGPNENALRAEPEEAVIAGERRRLGTPDVSRRSAEEALSPVRDGRASGFTCAAFPRKPAGGTGAAARRHGGPFAAAAYVGVFLAATVAAPSRRLVAQ